MHKIDLTSKEWCDIIFQGRNKDYGAYKIRKETGRRYLTALVCTLIIVISPLFYISIISLLTYRMDTKFTNVTELSNLKPAENKHKLIKKAVEQPSKTAQTVKRQKPSDAFCIKADKDVTDEDLSSKEKSGSATGVIEVAADSFALDDKEVRNNAINANIDPKIFRVIEQLPEFPGGVSAFMKWLTLNLKYPKSAQQDNVKGKVVVQFIINKNGTISDLKIVHSLNSDCDREVLRVLSTMPKWKPGIEDGKPTRTQYVIPIVFNK